MTNIKGVIMAGGLVVDYGLYLEQNTQNSF